MFRLGNRQIPAGAMLAPMAGVADRAFREVCVRWGAVYVVGEMASAKGLTMRGDKTRELLELSEAERPAAVQLFGSEPQVMAQAAREAEAFAPDAIDINMGCPVPKVAGNGCGSALMRDPLLAGQIIRAVVEATSLPVTVKIRAGWDDQSINAVEIARIAQEEGAAAVAVHCRTRQQMYSFPVDWTIIRQVKEALSIPVIGNGGIRTPQEAKAMYDQTGCDLVMIGQGALGAPWIFRQVNQYLETGTFDPAPPLEERLAVFRDQAEAMVLYKGETVGLREARKHAGWYLRGCRGAAALRRQAGMLSTMADLEALIARALEENLSAFPEDEA